MSLQKDRTRSSVKGLGNMEVRELSAGVTFDNVGNLDADTGTNIEDFVDVEEIMEEGGTLQNVKEKSRIPRFSTNLLQTSLDEINLNKQALGKEHAIRYFGMHSPNRFQYFCIPRGKINPGVSLGFKNGKRVLPINAWALKQSDAAYDIPEYYIAETKGKIRTENLQLWINPRDAYAYNVGTDRVLDISGFERHGQLNSDYATIWYNGLPYQTLGFDGVNDVLNHGNILNINTNDYMIEAWARMVGGNATYQAVLGKRGTTDGIALFRSAANKMSFQIGDNVTSFTATESGTTTIGQLKYFVITISKNGNATLYADTVAGTPVNISSLGTITNSIDFTIGKESGNYGAIQVGGVRVYNFGSNGLPSDISTIITNHYNAEKSYYGL